jgi:hypothetical protein
LSRTDFKTKGSGFPGPFCALGGRHRLPLSRRVYPVGARSGELANRDPFD